MLLPSAFTTSVFAVSDRIQMEIWNTRADLVWASHMAYNSKWIFKGALHPGHSVNKWWSVSSVVRIPFSEWLHIKVRWRGSRHGQGQGGMNGDNVTQSLFEVLHGVALGCTPRKSSCRRMKKDSLREQFKSILLSDVPHLVNHLSLSCQFWKMTKLCRTQPPNSNIRNVWEKRFHIRTASNDCFHDWSINCLVYKMSQKQWKMLIFQSPKWCLQVAYFVQPTVQEEKII